MASTEDVELKFVSQKKAYELRDQYTKEELHMSHYWEKAAAYVCAQEQRFFPMGLFDDEYSTFEASYFAGLPRMVFVTMNMDTQQTTQRMLKWTKFTL